jgi:hypothetical protein
MMCGLTNFGEEDDEVCDEERRMGDVDGVLYMQVALVPRREMRWDGMERKGRACD